MSSKKTIMLVEDDGDLIDLVSDALKAKYRVIACRNGEQAKAKMSAKIDAIVTDLTMPYGNGLEVRDAARVHGIPVVFWSGNAVAYSVFFHGEPVVNKPDNSAAIIAALEGIFYAKACAA